MDAIWRCGYDFADLHPANGPTDMHPTLWFVPGIDYPVYGYGFMLMIGFLSGSYLAFRRARIVRADPKVVLYCAALAILGGVVGAKVFYIIHYWDEQSLANLTLLEMFDPRRGGLEFLGGVAGGMGLVIGYLLIRRASIRLYLDLIIPSLMLGLALTRVGCFLNGCCFGGTCDGTVAQRWAVQFPFGSPAYLQHVRQGHIEAPAELTPTDDSGRLVLLDRMDPALDVHPLAGFRHGLDLARHKGQEHEGRRDRQAEHAHAQHNARHAGGADR